MRGSRVLIIVGAVLVIGAIVVGVIFVLGGGREEPVEPSVPVGEEGTVIPEVPQVQIVVAAQDLARGVQITEAMIQGEAPAVILKDWPEEEIPNGAITRMEDVVGRTTRVDVVRDLPILASMLVEESPGSAASLQIPEGLVAYALPVARYSSVAWALQPGDYVDMIISLLLVDLDEEFQTITPLHADCVSPPEGEECKGGVMGRLEVLPNGWLVNLTPGEPQRSQLVTQLTIQNAIVLRVGDWPMFGEEPSEAPPEEPSTGEEEAAAVEEAKPSTPVLAPLTLAVTRQDAMVLEYAQLTGGHITFVLRRAGSDDRATTESITLQYLMDRYNIEIPTKLPYGVEPRIISLDIINRAAATEYQPAEGGVEE
jgi:pilus assembly protein CpaB